VPKLNSGNEIKWKSLKVDCYWTYLGR